MLSKTTRRNLVRRYPFAYIAFWQLMVFVLLICLVWISEFMDLPGLYYGAGEAGGGFYRGWLMTAAVCVCAIVMIGTTYVQQRRIIQGMLTICSKCGKIRVDEQTWEELRSYVSKKTLASFSFGLCPNCYKSSMEELEKQG